jgi:RAP domain
LHKEVISILEDLKVPHMVEGATPDGLLSIDVIIPRPGRTPVAVEVDGPLHFTALPPFRSLGHTALRDRFLRQRGFVFLGLPFYEWDGLVGAEEKRTFFVERLEALGVQIPPSDS